VKIAPRGGQGRHGIRRGHAPIADFEAYNNQLMQFVYHSGLI